MSRPVSCGISYPRGSAPQPHVEFPADQAQDGDAAGAGPQREVVLGAEVHLQQISPAAEEGADRIRFAVAKDHRHFVADDVAHHAAENPRNHPHHRGDEDRHAGAHGFGHAGDGEHAQADGVGHDDQAFRDDLAQMLDQGCGRQCQHEDENRVFLVRHPEQGPLVEQDVAQGAAAEGRDEGHDEDADQVHALAACFDETGKRAHQDGDDLDDLDQRARRQLGWHHGRNARTGNNCHRLT